jgi:hypothetical protein
VTLGRVGARSVAATIYGLVDRGSTLRPDLAAQLEGCIVIAFEEDYADVLVECGPAAIHVADCDGEPTEADLEIRAAVTDFNVLVAAPLAAGLPRPTNRTGRAALARVADGRVELRGSITLARRFLRLLSVAPGRAGRAP